MPEPSEITCLRDSARVRILPAVVRTIGQNIAAAREAADPKVSQSELARRIGKPPATVNGWEKGRYKSLDLKNLVAIAAAIPCSVDALIAGVFESYDQAVLSRHASTAGSALPSGGADVPAPARLLELLALYETRIREIEDVAGRLVKIAVETRRAGRQGRALSSGVSGRRSSHRKTG